MKNYCFLANFDPSYLYEKYLDKDSILVATSTPCVNTRIPEMTIGPGITV